MRLLMFAILLLSAPWAQASHTAGGIDLCVVYKEILPPGLAPSAMPEPDSAGARLVQRYCTQCHMQPGPGHHTAEEWPVVVWRMTQLMQDTARFRGLMGGVQAPSADDIATLTAYLERHALRAWKTEPVPAVLARACDDCHAVPDPAQHAPHEWPAVLQRMQHNRTAMGRAPLDVATETAVLAVLIGEHNADRQPALLPPNHAGTAVRSAPNAGGMLTGEAWLALGPFFALSAIGIWRWRRHDATAKRKGDHP